MEKTFYDMASSSTTLREGSYLNVQRSLIYRGERADFTPFLDVPQKELEKRLKVSKAEEQKVYDQLKEAAKAWDAHGAQTLLLQKAIEYLKTPEVKHTSNEWKQQNDGSWEISNLVYKMTFNIVKFGDEWKLSWELSYTAPGLAVGYWEYTRSPRQRIEHEGSKKYKTLEGAQKYIQSKFDQHAERFESLSPPIPKDAKALFSVNGQLLQGYSLMRQSPKKKKVTLDDLLACLEDEDLGGQDPEQTKTASPDAPPDQPLEQPAPPPPAQETVRAVQQPSPAKAVRPSKGKTPLRKKRAAMAR